MENEFIQRSRFRVRTALARSPVLFSWAYRHMARYRDVLISPDTQIMIEGFPRSANTFSVRAFLQTNPQTRVAHHIHAQAHVRLGIARDLPCVVLIRRPADAIRSLLVRHPYIGAGLALKAYLQFYRELVPYLDRFVVADFDIVTRDFATVIERVNRKFATDFIPFQHGQGEVERVFQDIESANAQAFGGEVNRRFVPRPDKLRDELKGVVSLDSVVPGLVRAEALYAQFVGGSGS